MEEDRRHHSRMTSEVLANTSHELRTPLNTIIGFTELMHDGRVGALSDEHREYLGDILSSARHLLRLINDVIDLANVESGKTEFFPAPIDLSQLISDVRDLVRAQAARKKIRIAVEVDPNLGEIVLEPATLKHVIYNYLSNALRFTPQGGDVTVRALPDRPGMFRLEVEDVGEHDGPGRGSRFHAILPRTAAE
jgi:signal transduction histidine kinase